MQFPRSAPRIKGGHGVEGGVRIMAGERAELAS